MLSPRLHFLFLHAQLVSSVKVLKFLSKTKDPGGWTDKERFLTWLHCTKLIKLKTQVHYGPRVLFLFYTLLLKSRSLDPNQPQSVESSRPLTQQGHLSLVILCAAPSFVILKRLSFPYLALMMMNNEILVTNVSVGHSWKGKNKIVQHNKRGH